jgi:hypothetical protein
MQKGERGKCRKGKMKKAEARLGATIISSRFPHWGMSRLRDRGEEGDSRASPTSDASVLMTCY